MSVTLRVREPTQAARFYRDVLGFQVVIVEATHVQVVLPGLALQLIHDDRLDALHGAGAGRHRPGVGVELHVAVESPAEIAERVRSRGGFLVAETDDAVSVRDGDGYLITFDRAV